MDGTFQHEEVIARRQRMLLYSGHAPPPLGGVVTPLRWDASGPALMPPAKHRFRAAYGAVEVGGRRIATSDLERLAMPKGLGEAMRFLPPVRGAAEAEPSVLVAR
jgi:hypothetical protein